MRKRRRFSTVRRPMVADRVKSSRRWATIKFFVLIACVSAGVILMILFGFPLIEDLVKGVDPSLRYQSLPEKEFVEVVETDTEQGYTISEMILADLKTKNDPYICGSKIIFTTRVGKTGAYLLDSVAVYDTAIGRAQILDNVEKKYDNLLSPLMNSEFAVWIDSMANGGGRIMGYDFAKEEQFLIKEYGYAMPQLAMDGDLLTFMQWAGEETQRLYVYNVRTREAVTVQVYETTIGNSASDISETDLVWSEYQKDDLGVSATLKRKVFEDGSSKFDNYELGMNVFEPKTNGKDIVFCTEKNTLNGSLMLSSGGNEPIKIAENVLNYDIGDNFVAYTKDDKIIVCYTNRQEVKELTSDISKNLLVSVNGNGLTFYDITDGVLTDEVVMYAYME